MKLKEIKRFCELVLLANYMKIVALKRKFGIRRVHKDGGMGKRERKKKDPVMQIKLEISSRAP